MSGLFRIVSENATNAMSLDSYTPRPGVNRQHGATAANFTLNVFFVDSSFKRQGMLDNDAP